MQEAENALRRLSSEKVNVTATLAVIAETDRLEQEIEAGSSYTDCFKSANWKRTEISIGVYCTQVLSGIYLINYGTYFFQQAGLATQDAFYMGIGFLGESGLKLFDTITCRLTFCSQLSDSLAPSDRGFSCSDWDVEPSTYKV